MCILFNIHRILSNKNEALLQYVIILYYTIGNKTLFINYIIEQEELVIQKIFKDRSTFSAAF